MDRERAANNPPSHRLLMESVVDIPILVYIVTEMKNVLENMSEYQQVVRYKDEGALWIYQQATEALDRINSLIGKADGEVEMNYLAKPQRRADKINDF